MRPTPPLSMKAATDALGILHAVPTFAECSNSPYLHMNRMVRSHIWRTEETCLGVSMGGDPSK